VPGFGPPDLARFPEGGTVAPNLATWLDQRVLGHHIGQSYPHDPEGLLTTLPAIATALIGVVVGRSLRGEGDEVARRNRLLIAGGALVAAGALWSLAFPLSKKLWTSSFVLLTGGASLLLFAVLHWFVDVRGKRRLVGVPLAFGGNALLTILLFTFVDNLLRVIPIGQRADHSRMAVKDFLYERALQPAFSPKNAAWVYSVVGIALLLPLFGLLRRRRIFLRA
jgi:predicted acyltransferase